MKHLFILFALVSTTCLRAQSTYTFTTIPYVQDTFTGGFDVTSSVDDLYTAPIGIGFPFSFYGSQYNSLLIGTNCVLSFDLTLANSMCAWDMSATQQYWPNNSILFPWNDVDISLGGKIRYRLDGVAPNRKFIVYFDSVPMYNSDNVLSNCYGLRFSGRVELLETTNQIDVYMKSKTACTSWNNGNALLAVRNAAGTVTTQISGHDLSAPWTATNEAWRFCPAGNCGIMPMDSMNVIKGRVFYDDDKDCQYDSSGVNVATQFVTLNNSIYTSTDLNGNYFFFVDTGSFEVSIVSDKYKSCGGDSVYHINFTHLQDSSVNNDFADTVSSDFCDIFSICTGTYWFRQCSDNNYINFCLWRKNQIADTAFITVTLPDSASIIGAPYPYHFVGNNQYVVSVPYAYAPDSVTCFLVQIHVGCLPVNSTLCWSASVQGEQLPCGQSQSTGSCANIIASFDPNEKLVASQSFQTNGYVKEENIAAGDSLSYKIFFQNTGTDTAFHIVVRDTLDGHLDPATAVLNAFSHPGTMSVSGNVLVFDFPSILLPDSNTNEPASHGWLTFSVKQTAGNLPGTVIENTAAIYFDNNAPVQTDTVTNTIPAPIYQHLLEDINIWHYYNNSIVFLGEGEHDSRATTCNYNFYYKDLEFTQGDTLIGSKLYKQDYVGEWQACLYGFLREDTLYQRVYFKDVTGNPEIVLYDFGMNIGDTMTINFYSAAGSNYYVNGIYRVDSVTHKLIKGVNRKVLYLNAMGNTSGHTLCWIEGVGSNIDVVYPYMINNSIGSILYPCSGTPYDAPILLTCFEHSTNVYFDSCIQVAHQLGYIQKLDSCKYFPYGGIDEMPGLSSLNLRPNPANTFLQVTLEVAQPGDFELSILDIQGRRTGALLPVTHFEGGMQAREMDVSGLANGLYLLECRSDKGVLYRKLAIQR